MKRTDFTVVLLALALLLQGCGGAPSRSERPGASPLAATSVGGEIALRAISLVGAPYRYGAHGPDAFDCSGLVRYVHGQLGINTPRTAAEQFSAATPVKMSGLAPGDLLFFRTQGRRVSHVGVYAGDGRFVHAPQTGRTVELRTLDDEYYRPRLAGAGRLF